MPKASVLPVPVRAWPMTSCSSSAIGRVSAWIGKALVMPAAARAAQMGSATPNCSNVDGVGLDGCARDDLVWNLVRQAGRLKSAGLGGHGHGHGVC